MTRKTILVAGNLPTGASALQEILHRHQLEAILLWNDSEIFWATGKTVRNACLIVLPNRRVIITPNALEGTGEFSVEEGASTPPPTQRLEVEGLPSAHADGEIENVVYGEYGFENCENPVENIYRAVQTALSGVTTVGITKHLKAIQVELQELDLRLVDVSRDIEEAMMCKSEGQIAEVRNSVLLNDEAFIQIQKTLKVGMSEFEVRAIVQRSYEEKTGKLLETRGDYLSGMRTTEISGEPTNKKVAQGDTLIVDIQVASQGAAVDTTRTFVLGKPSKEVAEAYKTVASALGEMETYLRPGLSGGEIYQKVSSLLKGITGQTLPHHAGHGVGYRWYEPPFLIASETREIRPGMIIAIEPGIYQESFGIRLENNFLITENGCENLSTCPYDLEWATKWGIRE